MPITVSYSVILSDFLRPRHTGEIGLSRTSAETLYVPAFMLKTSLKLQPNRLSGKQMRRLYVQLSQCIIP
jgi:hypothetical protein